MATPDTTLKPAARGFHLSTIRVLGVLALLAPLSYIMGRLSPSFFSNVYVRFWGSGVSMAALGVMAGIPLGLFFGSLRGAGAGHSGSGNTIEMEHDILKQLRAELVEDKALFEARKGSTTMFARIAYITPFWQSVKASGRLFVMQDAQLLATIGTAYYWLDQATHLETLAYEAKYATSAGAAEAGDATALRLITEARLLDGQLETSLSTAVSAIDTALAA